MLNDLMLIDLVFNDLMSESGAILVQLVVAQGDVHIYEEKVSSDFYISRLLDDQVLYHRTRD
jgi:hypothetical protein